MARTLVGMAVASHRPEQGPEIVKDPPRIFDFERDLGLTGRKTKPKLHGKVLTNRSTTIPDDAGPMPSCFDDDAKLLKL